MTALRTIVLVVALYVGLDLVDPLVPGVFSLDSETLFLDGIVGAKVTARTRTIVSRVGPPSPATEPLSCLGSAGESRPVPQPALRARPPTRHPRHTLVADAAREEDAHA